MGNLSEELGRYEMHLGGLVGSNAFSTLNSNI